MKKLIYTLFFVFISVVANGQAKYVFKMAVLVLNLCYLLNSRLLLWQLLSLLKIQ